MTYITPWVEYNQITPENFQHIVQGVKLWRDSGFVRTLFISTVFGPHRLVPRMQEEVGPNIRLLPGLKFTPMVSALDDELGWNLAASELTRVKNSTKAPLIIIDLETVSKQYIQGNVSVDLNKLEVCFNKLPPGKYLMWPMGSRNLDYQGRYLNILNASKGRVSIISNHIASSSFVTHTERLAFYNTVKTTLRSFGNYGPIASQLWFYGPDSPWWQDEEVNAALNAVPVGDWAIVYPGFDRWVDGSMSIISHISN